MLSRFFCFVFGVLLFSCSQEKKNTVHELKKDRLRISFTGDVLLDRGVRKVIEHKGADAIFKQVKPFFDQMDAVVVNFEGAATAKATPTQKKFVFRAEPGWLQALRNAGITHAVLANNHSYDQGRDGMQETATHLYGAGLVPIGFGKNQEQACAPVLIAKNNVQVAVFSSVWLTLERWNYLENEPGMCQCGAEKMFETIAAHRQKHPGVHIVVVLHWGDEYNTTPSPEQRMYATRLVEAGADVIIGHHPHVIQRMELVKGKPVFFSLGNFVFDHVQPNASKAGLAEIVFTADSVQHRFYTAQIVHCIPQSPQVSP